MSGEADQGTGLSSPEAQDYASALNLDPASQVLPPTADEIQVLTVLDAHAPQPPTGLDHQTAETPDPGQEHAVQSAPEGLHDSSLDHPLDAGWQDHQHHA